MRYEHVRGNILNSKDPILLCNVDSFGSTVGICKQFCDRFDGFEDIYISSCKNGYFDTTCLLYKSFKDINDNIKTIAAIRCKDWDGNSDYLGLKLGLLELKNILWYLDDKVEVAIPPLSYSSKHTSLSKSTIESIIKEVFWDIKCVIHLYNFE